MKLAVLALVLAACSSPPPSADVRKPTFTNVRIHRFTFADWDAYALFDGEIEIPNDGKTFGLGHTPEEVSAVLGNRAHDVIHLDLQPLLVKTGQRVLLFDTGAGTAPWARAGQLPRALAAAGTKPAEVTDVFLSHGHGDHVLGLVANDALAFPAATIHISRPEWAALQASEEDKALVATIASKVAAFEPGAAILPEVTAVDTRGHTPGHSSYLIGSGNDTLFYLGDVAHHSILSVTHPEWSIEFDMDRPAAEAMRQQTLAKLAADHTRVYAVHFPFPGLGSIETGDDVLFWLAE